MFKTCFINLLQTFALGKASFSIFKTPLCNIMRCWMRRIWVMKKIQIPPSLPCLKRPLYQRLPPHPADVQTLPGPILYMAGIAKRWVGSPSEHVIMRFGQKMAFRNFVVTRNDKDMSFIIKSPYNGSFGASSPLVPINNNDVDATCGEYC